MTGASHLSTIAFLALVALVMGLFTFAMRRASPAPGAPGRTAHSRALILVLAVWVLVPGALAAAGRLDRYAPFPPVALLPVLIATLTTMWLAFTDTGARLAAGIPFTILVGYQGFRVGVEWWLHRMSLEGAIPVQMTWSGRNFDVVSGATALLLALWLRSGHPHRTVVLAWNLLGLALLVNIVTVAVLSTPVSFRVFTNEPANLVPGTFPWVWLPTVLVQAALLGHLLVFRKLRAPSA